MVRQYSKVRLERLSRVRLLLVQDDLINYSVGGLHRYAYYGQKSLLAVFKNALIDNVPVDMLIERIKKGEKYVDYVREVKISEA